MKAPHIKIGDDLIQDALLASVEVTQELNQHWQCRIIFRQTSDKRIPVEDYLGKTIKVRTADDQGVEHVIFSGFILDVELDYEVWGSYKAQVIAISSSYKLDLTPRKAYYSEQTLQQVASQVTGHAKLSASVSASGLKALNYVQYGETDFSFLNRIVDDYGCWLRPGDDCIEVFNTFQSGATLQWRGENGLSEFKIKGTLGQPSFDGSHYNFHQMDSAVFKQVAAEPQFYDSVSPLVNAVKSQSQSLMPAGYVHQRARAMTLEDYQERLKKESRRSIGSKIAGFGLSQNQQLTAGNTIEIKGNLDAKGVYGLIKVIHHWEQSGYYNSFVCTPWKEYCNPEQPPLRAWYGVVPAQVVDHHDPKKMGRLKVQYFWQDDGSAHWARMVTPHAGPGRGFMFLPEVGDEVAVIFEDGDPERPVILGSLWNGAQTAPRDGYHGDDIADNDVKRIFTKSGNRIQIADKAGSEAITIATPNNASITISESHSGTGGRSLISLNSSGDIVFNAPNGRIHFISKFFSREVG